jgi:Ca2+/Na+ antiporter
MKKIFYIVSIIGFFFPYVLKFMHSSTNEALKIFALYSLGKFNLVYFAVIIIFFFLGLKEKFSFLRIAQVIFVSLYIGYVFVGYFILAKINTQNYIKKHNLNAKIVKLTELKNYPNFKIYYKEANFAAIKILPKKKNSLPFNYKKDRAQ